MKDLNLKFIRRITVLLLVASTALPGCGSDDQNAANNGGVGGVGGGASVIPGGVQSDGSYVVSFTGSTNRVSASRVVVGQFPNTVGNVSCSSMGLYDPSYACFRNRIGGTTTEGVEILGQTFGSLVLGSVSAFGGVSINKLERFYGPRDGRTSVSINLAGAGSGANVSGVITLSPTFVANELGGQQVIGIGLDLSNGSGIWGGQAFLLTGPNNGSFIVF